jgi:4-methyl-5(b-hydroxyethyl)-thiazole monophosphate biosynthesis
MAKKVVVLLAPGFEEIETATPIDFLRRAGFEVTVAGVGGKSIKGSHDLVFLADEDVAALGADFDALVVPGGMPGAANLAASDIVRELIRKVFDDGKLVASICASPAVVLSPLGILDGKKATCHPQYEKDLKCGSFSEERVVHDGNVITSRGPGTAAEFSIKIVEYLAGEDKAQELHRNTLQK